MTELDWGKLEYRAGASSVTLQSGAEAPLVSSEDEPTDGKFFVSESANYDIVCNLATKKVIVTKAAYQTTALKHTALWMIGSATKGGWSIGEGTIMKADATNPAKFSARTELKAGELKFGTNVYAGFDQVFYLRDLSNEGKIVFGGADNKWKVTKAGIYTFAVDLRTRKLTVTYEGEEPAGPILPIESEWLSFIGNATPYGWDIDGLKAKVQDGFAKTSSNPLQFTYEGHLNEGEFKLSFDKSDGWNNLIQAPVADCEFNHDGPAKQGMVVGGDDNKWKVTEAGTYTIVFDLTKHEIKVTKFVADAPAPAAPTPWDTENVYMIGSATPAGWSVDNGVSITKTGDHIFSIEVQLAEGEMKFMLDKSGFSGDKPYFFAPEENTVINETGVAKDALAYGTESSYGDKKWKVTKAGKYKLTLDLKNKKFKAEYISA